MKMKFLNYLSAGVVALGLTACTELEKADYNQTTDPSVLPTVTTGDYEAVINTAAIVSVSVDTVAGSAAQIQEVGVIVDTDTALNPVEGTTATFVLDADNTAKGVISGLMPGTHYYYRAYVSTNLGISLGEIKSFTTSEENYELAPIYTADFSDPSTMAGFQSFGTISDGVNFAPSAGWAIVPDLAGVFGGQQAFCFGTSGLANVESLLDPSLTTVNIGFDADNVLTTTVDLTGTVMPSVLVSLIDIDGFMLRMNMPGGVTVYASAEPINSFEDLDGATVLGSYNFTAGGDNSADATFSIPTQFYGKTCHIAIRSTSSYYTNNLGVFLYGFQVLSYEKEQ